MSKALRRYENQGEFRDAISRRMQSKTFGLGYWSAVEAQGPEVVREAVAAQRHQNPPRVKWDNTCRTTKP